MFLEVGVKTVESTDWEVLFFALLVVGQRYRLAPLSKRMAHSDCLRGVQGSLIILGDNATAPVTLILNFVLKSVFLEPCQRIGVRLLLCGCILF